MAVRDREILVRLNLRAEEYNQNLRRAEQRTDTFKGKVDKLNGSLKAMRGTMAAGLAVGAIAGITALGVAAVKTANDLGKLKLQVAAVIAANGQIKNASGQILQGVEKIKAAQVISADLFRQLQKDALKTTATTKELIDQLTVALPAGLSSGLSAMQVEKVVISASNAMKILSINADQAKSELRALFSGDINQDADLAKSLNIRKEDIELAKEQGRLYEFLVEKLKDFNAAAEIQSQSLNGVTSSVKDMGDKWMALIGQRPLEILTEGARQLLHEIMGDEKATTDLHNTLTYFATDASKGLSQMVKAVIKVGEAIGWVIDLLMKADYNLQSWAINANEAVGNVVRGIQRFAISLGGKLPWNRDAAAEALKQLDAEAARRRAALGQRRADLNMQRYGGIEGLADAVDPGMTGPQAGGQGSPYTYTPNPQRESASAKKAREMAAKKAKAASDKAVREAEARQRELEREQDRMVGAMADAMRFEMQVNDAYEGGMTGRIKILQKYIEELKKLPRAEEEVRDAVRALTLEQIELKVHNAKEAIEAAKREKEARMEALEQVRQYELALAEAERDKAVQQVEFSAEDAAIANERATAELDRLWNRGAIEAEEYYRRLRELQEGAMRNEAAAAEARLREERKVVELRVQQLKNPTEGLVDWSAVTQAQGELARIDAELGRIPERLARDLDGVAIDYAQNQADRLEDETKDGLNKALDAVFTGDLTSISQGLRQAAQKGLVEAMASTQVGGAIGKLFSGAGGWKGALIAGFLDLIIGSFKDLGVEGERLQRNAIELDSMLNDDPVAAARREVDAMRKRMFEERKKTVKFLGLIPLAHTPGFTTPEEQAKLDQLEQKKVSEAKSQLAASELDKALTKLNLLRRVGKATTDDLIKELQHVLGTAELTEEKALELQAQLQDLQAEKRQEKDGDFDEQLSDQLHFNEISLRAARDKVAAEMALVDRSTEYGKDRYRELRRQLKDLNDQIADETAQAAEEAARQFEESWERATDRSSEFFKRFAEAASNELEFLKRAYDSTFLSLDRDLKVNVAYDRTSRKEAEYTMLGRRVEALQDQINDLLRLNSGDQSIMNTIAQFYSGAYLNGSDWLGNSFGTSVEGMSNFLKELARRVGSGGYVSTRPGGQGYQMAGSNLGYFETRWAAANQANSTRQAEIVALREEIARLKVDRDVVKAEVEGPAGRTIRDLDLEYKLLLAQYRKDPAAEAAARKAQIDRQIEDRRLQLFHEGLLSGQFDIEEQALIASRLDALKDLMKAQVDAEARNRPTEANPLPVRVVDLPPAFALPASAYFRAQSTPVLQLAAGAIQINGSGLSDTELMGAVQQAIVNAGSDLTRVVNRQNTISGAMVRLN